MKLSVISKLKEGKLPRAGYLIQLIVLILFAGLSSCEYQLKDEEFVEIKPPDGIHNFSINMLAPGDTLFLFNPTILEYDINAYGLDIQRAVISLARETWPIKSSGQLRLDPKDLTPGIHTLTLLLTTNSGTGSIGDITGNEGYNLKMEWVAVVDSRSGPLMEITSSINEDGFLSLKWNSVKNLNFCHYEFTRWFDYKSQTKLIYNQQDTTFIDSCYIAGKVSYTLRAFVKSKWADVREDYLSVDEPIPHLSFQMNGIDSVNISWNKTKYPANYELYQVISNTPNLIASGADTSYTFLGPSFGSSNTYHFVISPLHPSQSCETSFFEIEYFSQGKILNTKALEYACNTIDGLIYAGYSSDLKAFDVNTLEEVNSYAMGNLAGLFSCPPNSTKLATLRRFKEILIFNDNQLTNPIIIPASYASPDFFKLTTNNLVAVAEPNRFALLSAKTQQQVAALAIEDYPANSPRFCLDCSVDGQYAAVCTNNGIRIYNTSQQSFEEIFHDTRNYRSLKFNDYSNNELFITLKDLAVLEVRNSANFNLIRTISLPNVSVICNIDPYTGYMLLTDFTLAYILDLNSGQIKLTTRSVDKHPKLINGWLLSETGNALNISTYLP